MRQRLGVPGDDLGGAARAGVREDDPATWPPLAEISCLDGEPFAAAATSPALTAAYDE